MKASGNLLRRVMLASSVLWAFGIHANEAHADNAPGYADHPRAQPFVNKMVNEHGWDEAEVRAILAQAQKQDTVIKSINRPAESKAWAQYQDIFLTAKRLDGGVDFWRQHAAALARAEREYGVPSEIVVSILGVETYYGQRMGSYLVVDALVTQAFEFDEGVWRSRFGLEQLEHLLLLSKEQGFNPLELKGSYAGAMGYGQFIPSSYRHFAVDFDGDEVADIWGNPVDAIGSVANYLSENGWRRGGDITVSAQAAANADRSVVNRALKADSRVSDLATKGYKATTIVDDQAAGAVELEGKGGAEYWLGLHNYFVITTYNHSRLYAMAVFQLSEQVKGKRESDNS
jgi:membrane-bound lytic murein transglycosylase B